jgi:hypothetical protein
VDLSYILGVVGIVGAVACFGAYAYGFIFKVSGFRPLSVLSLFSTVVALAQLSLFLTHGGGPVNVVYATVFVAISGLAQSLGAVKARPPRDGVRTRQGD